jgi:hypothetical protein
MHNIIFSYYSRIYVRHLYVYGRKIRVKAIFVSCQVRILVAKKSYILKSVVCILYVRITRNRAWPSVSISFYETFDDFLMRI